MSGQPKTDDEEIYQRKMLDELDGVYPEDAQPIADVTKELANKFSYVDVSAVRYEDNDNYYEDFE